MKLNLKRIHAALVYLLWSNAPLKWRFSFSLCPRCGSSLFIHLRPDAFMTRCLRCSNNTNNLALIKVISDKRLKFNTSWEMSTYGATHDFLKENSENFVSSEYKAGYQSGTYFNGYRVEDATNSSFKDNQFDLITSNQVFEHIPNDKSAYEECRRILKKGGILLFAVPLYDYPETKKKAEIVDGELKFFGEPEYHNSRLEGPASAPTFWHHSKNDLVKRVEMIGFEVKKAEVKLGKGQHEPATVFICKKL